MLWNFRIEIFEKNVKELEFSNFLQGLFLEVFNDISPFSFTLIVLINNPKLLEHK